MKKKAPILFFIFISFLYLPRAQAANQGDVVINEISWMGTTNSANDEWLELKNTTDDLINLSGWVLKSADEKIKIPLKNMIPAKGFYLLERTDDASVPATKADIIYTGALNNTGQHLLLYDNANNIIDQVNFLSKWRREITQPNKPWKRVLAQSGKLAKTQAEHQRMKIQILLLEIQYLSAKTHHLS